VTLPQKIASDAVDAGAVDAGKRDAFVPVRKAALLDALLADQELCGPLERDCLASFSKLLGSILHFEYFSRLESVRLAYHPVDPEDLTNEPETQQQFERHYDVFIAQFEALLRGANFVEVSPQEIDRAHTEHSALRVEVQTSLEDFHSVRFFRRGRDLDTFEVKPWYGFGKKSIDVEVYRHVVLLTAIKPRVALDEDHLERLRRSKLTPGSVLIKCFRSIASADLNVLLPNVRITMSLLDKLMLGIPALVGGVPIILKLVSSLTVVFVVMGFYLGLRGSVDDDEMKAAIAGLGGLVALGAFLIRQWVKYERQSLRYLKEITDKVFFRSINHNAGFFDYILGTAEDQDHKEALLAYAFLRRRLEPIPPTQLRIEIENWLKQRFGLALRFEVIDALDKLMRFKLVRQSADGYMAVPLDEALSELGRTWHGFFPNSTKAAPSEPTPASA
jgi:hypothetical protein